MTETDDADRDERRLEWALGLLAAAVGAAVFAAEDRTEDVLRGWSGVLQIAGILTTALGLSNLRRRFSDRPSLATRVGNRLRAAGARTRRAVVTAARKISRRKPPTKVVNVGVADGIGLAGSATVRKGYPPPPAGTPVVEQLDILHLHVQQIQEDLEDEKARRARELAAGEAALAEEARRRGDDMGSVRKLIEDLAVGGLRLGAIGVVLLVVGVAMATWAPEFADWLPADWGQGFVNGR